jgi:small subunit ribosomal protein S4
MVIAVKESSRSSVKFKALAEANAVSVVPKWLEKDGEHFSGKVVAMPAREDIDYEVQEHLIVELYSK